MDCLSLVKDEQLGHVITHPLYVSKNLSDSNFCDLTLLSSAYGSLPANIVSRCSTVFFGKSHNCCNTDF